MTFRSLALSNIKGNWRAYSAFFFSSAFSVFIFYIYAAFLFHPEVDNGFILAADKVKQGMMFCLYLIIIFSFLFVLYSNSAFLKTRKKEFGLFSLFGMTRNQLRKLVIYENIAISLLAISVGIGAGIIFSKLFFMALAVLLRLDETIPFAIPFKAVWITGGGFFALFFVLSLWSSLMTGRSQIIDLLKEGQKPKGKLVYSKWLVALAAFSLIACYSMASIMDGENFLVLSLPILFFAVIGTYFFFTQLSILFLRMIQKREKTYFKRTNMLIFSQLGYKIRDNARILFIVTILSAVILTAMGSVYIMQIQMKEEAFSTHPHAIAFTEQGLDSERVLSREQLEKAIASSGQSIKFKHEFTGVPVSDYLALIITTVNNRELGFSGEGTQRAVIISQTEFNAAAKQLGIQQLDLPNNKLAFIRTSFNDTHIFATGSFSGKVMGEPIELAIDQWINNFAMNRTNLSTATLVASDETYNGLIQNVPENERIKYYGYELKSWEKAAQLGEQLTKEVPNDQRQNFNTSRIEIFESNREGSSLTLFIGLFISLLFFVASGSVLYFKLFTEIQEDKQQMQALARIGLTKSEMRRTVISQIAILFFIPCIAGIVHSFFAMISLGNMMRSSNWVYSFVVMGIFVGMQFIYFLLASRSYMKALSSQKA